MMTNYHNSPLNYTGSKYKLLDQLLVEFDYDKSNFIDLFAGSFVVGANVVDHYDQIIGNDIIVELIEIHKELLRGDKIIELTKLVCPNKNDQEAYIELRKKFNLERKPEQLYALMLSCQNNFLRFNKKMIFNQTFGKRSWNSATDIKVENWTEHIRKYKNKILLKSCNFNEIEFNSTFTVVI